MIEQLMTLSDSYNGGGGYKYSATKSEMNGSENYSAVDGVH